MHPGGLTSSGVRCIRLNLRTKAFETHIRTKGNTLDNHSRCSLDFLNIWPHFQILLLAPSTVFLVQIERNCLCNHDQTGMKPMPRDKISVTGRSQTATAWREIRGPEVPDSVRIQAQDLKHARRNQDLWPSASIDTKQSTATDLVIRRAKKWSSQLVLFIQNGL